MSFAATPSASQMQRVRAVPRVADVIGAMLRDEAAGVFSVSTERAVATVCGRQSTAAELRRESRVAAHELEAAREQAAELHAEMAATTHRAATNFGTAATLRPRRSSSITGAMGAAQLARELRSGSTSRRAAGGDDDASLFLGLEPVNHAATVYEPFTREFYRCHSEILRLHRDPALTATTIAKRRAELEVRVRAPRGVELGAAAVPLLFDYFLDAQREEAAKSRKFASRKRAGGGGAAAAAAGAAAGAVTMAGGVAPFQRAGAAAALTDEFCVLVELLAITRGNEANGGREAAAAMVNAVRTHGVYRPEIDDSRVQFGVLMRLAEDFVAACEQDQRSSIAAALAGLCR
jgi:hypothetical protein